MENKISYIFFDGDNVGSTIEALLLLEKTEDARIYSNSLNQVISDISSYLSANRNVDVIILGGDDILIKVTDNESETKLIIDTIIKTFSANSQKSTISCGVGTNIENAIIALDRAKIFGKNRIFYHK
jgi:hypothetical protein